MVTSDPQVRITVSTSDRISAGSLAMSAGSDGVATSGNGGCSCRCAKVRSLTPDMSCYLRTLAGVVFAVVEDALDLATMTFGTNGKNLFPFFASENADVFGFLLYDKPTFRCR